MPRRMLSLETVVRARQAEYYAALSSADRESECTPFVAFMLEDLERALAEALGSAGSEKSSAKILALLKANPTLPARELAQRLEMSPRGVEKQIAALRDAGR